MSVCHWVVEGIGLEVGKLWNYLSKEKCLAFLENECGYEFTDEEKKNFSIDDEFEDFIDGKYMNVAEAFCACDETGFMTFGDDGDGGCYFIYPPKYPWQCKENEPKSIDEVHKIIKDAVHKLCDISDEELEYLIDNDIYEYGCG